MTAERPPTLLYAVTVGLSARTVLKGQFREMRRRGFRTMLVCAPDEGTRAAVEEEGAELFPLPMTRSLLAPHDLVSFLRAVRLLRRTRPDVVYYATPKAAFLLGLAARVCRVPVRVYGMWGLRLEGERPNSLRYRVLRAAEYLTCRSAHAVLLPSESLRRRAVSSRVVRPERTVVLGPGSANGVDLDRFPPVAPGVRHAARLDEGVEPDAVVFGFVGRIVLDKGIHTLVRAFDALPEQLGARLLLVGDLEDGHRLPPSVAWRIREDPRIRVTGFVDNPDYWYRLMDVFVLPSRREGLPTVLLEAAASALPVITTRATGCPDAVEEGVTGLVVPVDDATALADAMLALGRDRGRRERMGLAGREFVARHFDQPLVWARMAEFVGELALRRAPGPVAERVRGSQAGAGTASGTVNTGRSA